MVKSREPLKFWRNHIPGTADRLRRCQLSSPVSVINFWRSTAMLITSTVEICIQQLGRVEEMVFTARRRYASAVLGVVILSVRPSVHLSVCHMRALWLIQRTYRGDIFIPQERAIILVKFVQLCSSWRHFNWFKASRGPSAIAELLEPFAVMQRIARFVSDSWSLYWILVSDDAFHVYVAFTFSVLWTQPGLVW